MNGAQSQNLVLKELTGYYQQPFDRGTIFIPMLNGKAEALEDWRDSSTLTH